MSSEKQIQANQKNALLSTGPVSTEGKLIVASNAIRHGIFAKDVILSVGSGREDQNEYLELLNNLIGSLLPQNQMESLLVEKIATDFWRMRRVIRCETGSIARHLEELFNDFYSCGKKNNVEIDQEISWHKQSIDWNCAYIKCLEKHQVEFDAPIWEWEDIKSDILEDFYHIAKTINGLSKDEKEKVEFGDFNFNDLKAILEKNGYHSKKDISLKLVELYMKQNERSEKEIERLEERRLKNAAADALIEMIGMVPQEESVDKILKYERSLQKSIFQNIFLLRKLQGLL
ncbi:MAG: hypothetical protein JSR93_07925 [Verrucomicrobia bacterium]|nr:hypothetical protein [Verrucomicrobiota bacterium]